MISVVIPLFNKAPHIIRTLESVLAQTVQPKEIIIVDDGSTDNGAGIVADCFAGRVKLIRQANAGESAARNVGVAQTSARYVAFLDADDEWLPQHLETLLKLIERHPGCGLYSTSHYIRENGHMSPAQRRRGEECGFDFFTAYAGVLALVNASTACVDRKLFMQVGGFPIEVRRGEDVILWCKLAVPFGMAHVSVPTAIYNHDGVNRICRQMSAEPPGSLVYLAHEWLSHHDVESEMKRGVQKLFDQIAIATSAGMKLQGDSLGMAHIRCLGNQYGSPWLRLKLGLLILMPNAALLLARKLRRKFG